VESDPKKFENFEEAFKTSGAGCFRQCHCGRGFYNAGGGWDWEPGELEALENSDATNVEWSVGTILVLDIEYVLDCDCWHAKAAQMIEWLDRSATAIVRYLKLEKQRKQREADESPVLT